LVRSEALGLVDGSLLGSLDGLSRTNTWFRYWAILGAAGAGSDGRELGEPVGSADVIEGWLQFDGTSFQYYRHTWLSLGLLLRAPDTLGCEDGLSLGLQWARHWGYY
jgi:hypothetical protein